MNTQNDSSLDSCDYSFEFRSAHGTTWYPSPHLRRPLLEAADLVDRLNAVDRSVIYRYVVWEGK